MDKKILVILFLVAIAFYFCYPKVEGFAQKMRWSNVYGANSSRSRHSEDDMYEVGVDSDDNKPIYKYKNGHFKLKDNFNFEAYEAKKIKYLPVAVKIPTVITAKSIKSKVPMRLRNYRFKGLVANTYYKQYYILYEKEYKNYKMEDKLYKYLLVKKGENGKYDVVHEIPPRNRVEVGDSIFFSYGNFQLGPLKFV